MNIHLPETTKKRIVILGGGFAGFKLAQRLAKSRQFQIVLIDKNNYHQFQPLLYQVAMGGLEPSSIAFPLRKAFQKMPDVFLRVTEVLRVDPDRKQVITELGECSYDLLVLALGATTNYYGDEELAEKTIPMKSVSEALFLRNSILSDFEQALSCPDMDERQGFLDIVVVGGGPTGVEVSGALAEMKKYILPRDYPELDSREIDIYLVQSAGQILKGMSDAASQKSLEFLKEMGVKVMLNSRVSSYDGEWVTLSDGQQLRSRKVIWAAGVLGNSIGGLPAESVTKSLRLLVNSWNQVQGTEGIYAIGDIACMISEEHPGGHPQVAQVAMQQADRLADNLLRQERGETTRPFRYRNLGSMATIGRNRAVADLNHFSFQGFFAWAIWLFVHLFQLLGVRNKLVVFMDWIWSYATYDQSLRLIIRPRVPNSGSIKVDR